MRSIRRPRRPGALQALMAASGGKARPRSPPHEAGFAGTTGPPTTWNAGLRASGLLHLRPLQSAGRESGRVGDLPWRRHPGGDLRTGVEAELVQDVLDVRGDGPLGDEKPRSDLLVAQALRDKPRDLHLALAKYPCAGAV